MDGVLQVYGQDVWHGTLKIIGDEAGLLALSRAIEQARNSGFGHENTFASDGEGYSIVVVLQKEDAIRKLESHYADESAFGAGDSFWGISGLRERYAEIMAIQKKSVFFE